MEYQNIRNHINSLALLFSRAQYSKIRPYGDYTNKKKHKKKKKKIIFLVDLPRYLPNALISFTLNTILGRADSAIEDDLICI